MAFVDDVVIDNNRDGFCPSIFGFKVSKQVDKQHRTFTVAANVADFSCAAVQCSGKIVFFILSRCDHALLLPAQLSVHTDFGIEVNIHFIFIKDRMLCATFFKHIMYSCYFSSLCGSRIRNVGAALRQTNPADGNPWRTVPACN